MNTEEALATFAGKFGASKHRPTFGRSFVSEVKKLNMRAIFITIVVGVVFQLGTTFLMANPDWADSANSDVVTFGAQFISLYTIIFGTLAVTTEYSHNTMRTTALADPNRTRSYLSKLAAVALLSATYVLVMIAIGWLVATIRLNSFDAFDDGLRPYIAMVAILTLVALMTAGFGYILRSTAGTITLMTGLVFLADLFTLLPLDFFRQTYAQLTPYALMGKAIGDQDMVLSTFVMFDNRWIALAIFAGYTLVVLVIGWVLYRKRDI